MIRYLKILSIALAGLTLLVSCGKDNPIKNKVDVVTTTDPTLTVLLNKTQIVADGTEQVLITVTDQNNADVTASSTLYVNGSIVTKNTFSTNTAGSYQVKATKGSLSSAVVNLIAVNLVTNQSLTVVLNKSQIKSDGTEQVLITVKDQSNTDVTSSSIIYVNGTVLTNNSFSTNTPGSYQVKATKGSLASAVVTLIASITVTTSQFTQKVLAEFFTGTWCGICPGTLIPLDSYTNANPNTIMIGIHGPNGSSDPFTFIYDSQLRNTYGVGGVPSVLLNRNGFWDSNTASLDHLTSNSALLGIGLESTLSGTTITAKVKVKFGVNISVPLKLVVMLVEDGIPYDQANYGHFNLPNPIVAFSHRNVLRSTATDVFGDAVPIVQQTKDNVWQKDFSINASKYQVSRCKIVAFVLYDTNSQNLKGVLNAQIASAGQTVNY